MSLESVQTIVGKAVLDREYRELLFSHPDDALKGHDLAPGEISSLKALSREKFDAVAGDLEEQMLGSIVAGNLGPGVREATIQPADLSRFGMMVING